MTEKMYRATSPVVSDERQMVDDQIGIDNLVYGVTLGNIDILVNRVKEILIENHGLSTAEWCDAELDWDGSWEHFELVVKFKRLENDEEYKKRMDVEEKKRIAAKKKEQRERTMLANLKKKYEGVDNE